VDEGVAIPARAVGYADVAVDSYREFVRLRDDGVVPEGVRFQVSVPTPFAVVVAWASGESQRRLWQPFKDALDWILSGSPDERRVDTGEALGATAEAVLERARASKRSAVDGLNQRLDALAADSAARLAVIDRLATVIQTQQRLLRPLPVRIVLKLLGWLRVV
jgi:hypothetical protein